MKHTNIQSTNNYMELSKKYNLDKIRYFVALVEHKSFKDAANALYMTQQALSASLSSFESILGFKLVERTKRFQSLTPMGEKVYKNVKEILNEFYDVSDKFNLDFLKAQSKEINLFFSGFVPPILLADIIKDFNLKNPDVKINLIKLNTQEEVENKIINSVNTIAILVDPPEHKDITYIEIKNSEFVIVANKKLKTTWDKLEYISLSSKYSSYVTKIKGTSLSIKWPEKDFPIKTVFQTSRISLSRELCEEGIGAIVIDKGFVIDLINANRLNIVAKIPFKTSKIMKNYIVWNKNYTNNIAKDFLMIVRAKISEISEPNKK